jgi:hypothetical protein
MSGIGPSRQLADFSIWSAILVEADLATTEEGAVALELVDGGFV